MTLLSRTVEFTKKRYVLYRRLATRGIYHCKVLHIAELCEVFYKKHVKVP